MSTPDHPDMLDRFIARGPFKVSVSHTRSKEPFAVLDNADVPICYCDRSQDAVAIAALFEKMIFVLKGGLREPVSIS